MQKSDLTNISLASLTLFAGLTLDDAAAKPAPKDHSLAARRVLSKTWLQDTAPLKTHLAEAGISVGAPVFLRAFKEDPNHKFGVLEIWAADQDGVFKLIKDIPICFHSGGLGPKVKEGDRQVPEGVYSTPGHRADSKVHKYATQINFPNAVDIANKRTGTAIQIHEGCFSIGCLAIGDKLAEELVDLENAAVANGQSVIQVHIFPFRMTEENMQAHQAHKHIKFWRDELLPIYLAFENTRKLPEVLACDKSYKLADKVSEGEVCTPAVQSAEVMVASNAPVLAYECRIEQGRMMSMPIRMSAVMSLVPKCKVQASFPIPAAK